MSKSFIAIAGLAFIATFSMGVQSCSEPKEYCAKAYSSDGDRSECSDYCGSHKDFIGSPRRQLLIETCEAGQRGFLEGQPKISAADAILACDRRLSDRELAAACRSGVTAEELRLSKSRSGAGQSSDRETGNNR